MDCIDKDRRFQDYDNYLWIKHAGENHLVMGTQARILYQDGETRKKSPLLQPPGSGRQDRSYYDGPGSHGYRSVDAPSRETSNIHDGSNITADMSALVYGGDAAMGMTMMTIHNGGGTGIGNSQSCGYGLLLDGSPEVDEIICRAVNYDVMCGVARRAWQAIHTRWKRFRSIRNLEILSPFLLPVTNRRCQTQSGCWKKKSNVSLHPLKHKDMKSRMVDSSVYRAACF